MTMRYMLMRDDGSRIDYSPDYYPFPVLGSVSRVTYGKGSYEPRWESDARFEIETPLICATDRMVRNLATMFQKVKGG